MAENGAPLTLGDLAEATSTLLDTWGPDTPIVAVLREDSGAPARPQFLRPIRRAGVEGTHAVLSQPPGFGGVLVLLVERNKPHHVTFRADG